MRDQKTDPSRIVFGVCLISSHFLSSSIQIFSLAAETIFLHFKGKVLFNKNKHGYVLITYGILGKSEQIMYKKFKKGMFK